MNKLFALLALAGTAAIVGSAQAFVPWVVSNGSASKFDWFNGGSDNGLFGSPVLVGGNTWVFFPSSYRAQTVDAGFSFTTDRMSVDILAHAGEILDHFVPQPTWSYSIVGNGSVSAHSRLVATDLINGARTLVSVVDFSANAPGSGDIHPFIDLNLIQSPLAWINFNLSWEVTFTASSGPDGSAFIEQRVFNMLVPAPGSLALLGVAALASRRRRRST